MPYLGNDLQVAQPSYRNIDDISSSFNSVTTSFALLVGGFAPVPFPINSNQCLISVAGVVQRPDDSGAEGFRLSGGNIIFSSAPTTGSDFFGVILAGADYVNVGANFPSGSASVPSITFDSDLDTGIYNSAPNQVSITTSGTERLRVDSSGQIESVSLGSASSPAYSWTADPNTGIYSPGADQVAVATNGTGRLFVDASGNVTVGTTTAPGSNGKGIALYDASFPRLSFRNSTTGDANTDGTQMLMNGNNFIIANTENGYTSFENNGSERLRITSAGLVGVGTSAPSYNLDVNGTIRATALNALRLESFANAGVYATFTRPDQQYILALNIDNNGARTFDLFDSTNSHVVDQYLQGASGYRRFCTNGAERLRITSAGLVGIGNSIPGSFNSAANQLVVGNGSADQGLTVYTGTANQGSIFFADGTTGGAQQAAGYIVYPHGGDYMAFGTANTERLRITSAGAVGIGTTSPVCLVNGQIPSATSTSTEILRLTDNVYCDFKVKLDRVTTVTNSVCRINTASGNLALETSETERARIDSSGRLLVGTSSARSNFFNTTLTAGIQVEGTGASTARGALSVVNNDSSNNPALIILGRSRTASLSSNTVVADGDWIGTLSFQGADGTEFVEAASVTAYVDGTPGANDMPGRLVFSTTADGASSPTERMRITNSGYLKVSNTGAYIDAVTGLYSEFGNNATQTPALALISRTTSFISDVFSQGCFRAASTAWACARFFSGDGATNGFNDTEFVFRGDGNGFCDGAWTGGGADYAEYFEWSDANPDEEDRRGISVVLDGDKIRQAVAGEDPIGVISGNPSVVGDAAWNKWTGKYLRDEFGTYIQEDYEVEDEDGNTVVQQRRKLNPAYDPDVEYIPREQRPEWDCVGLMGKLRIRKGQVTGSRWIKMRDINDSVEEWLVR